jgi:hypothetical protein
MTHMSSDDRTENKLRELLRDPRWSLPSWPDAEIRVRKAARRQRLRVTGVAAGAGIAAITAIALPLTVPGTPAPGPAATGNVVILNCQNSAGQQGRDTSPARLVHGVDGFIGDTNAYDTLPVQHLDGHRYLAWKTALSVAPDAGPYRTVSVVTPASARLSYGSGIAASSRSVRLPACGHRYALYVGGILVRRPACVTLAVSGPSGRQTTVAVPVLRSCPPRAR